MTSVKREAHNNRRGSAAKATAALQATAALLVFFGIGQLGAAPGETRLISRADVSLEQIPSGIAARNTTASERHVSRDGNLIVFSSASRLSGYAQLNDDGTAYSQVFLHHRDTGKVEVLSKDAAGFIGNHNSGGASISPDGRYVVYTTGAENLILDPRPGEFRTGIIILDRQTGRTEQVPRWNDEISYYGPQMSADANIIVYLSQSDEFNRKTNVFAYNRSTRTTTQITRSASGGFPNDNSLRPSLSANGRFVAYESEADDIVANDSNRRSDIFVFDLQTLETERVSVDQWGFHGILDSYAPAISRDGRFVAFHTKARNLVRNDTNDANDVVVYDRQTGIPARISVATDGSEANGDSTFPAISEDGRFVAFQSTATNLIANDNNDRDDIYVHDRDTGNTKLISQNLAGQVAAEESDTIGISATGRYISFVSRANNLVDSGSGDAVKIFVHDQQNNSNFAPGVYSNDISLPSVIPGDQASRNSVVNADGSIVVFESRSENLLAPDPQLNTPGLYALNTLTGTMELISDDYYRASISGYDPQISADGFFIAMNGREDGTIGTGDHEIQLYNRSDRTRKVVNRLADGTLMDRCWLRSLSADGRFIGMGCDEDILPGDSNDTWDAMVVDSTTNEIEIVSVNSNGQQADGFSDGPWLSANGQFALFRSTANNLDSRINDGYAHLYVRDRATGTTELISLGTSGAVGNGSDGAAKISADGRFVVFESQASNLVPDSGARFDRPRIFLRDRLTNTTSLVCMGPNGEAANAACRDPSISADGNRISYQSSASNLVADDRNDSVRDIFVFDRPTGTTQIASVSSLGVQTKLPSRNSTVSNDGRFVVFESFSIGLDSADKWPVNDIFLHEISADDSSGPSSFSVSPVSIDENAGTANVVVRLTPVSSQSSSVRFATRAVSATAGADFYGTSTTLEFPPGTATQTVNISVLNDTVVESDEEFQVRLYQPIGDVIIEEALATVSIVDDDSGNGGPVYADVPSSYYAFDEIQRFYAAGIAGRCAQAPLRFCPENYLRRDVMALWLGRAKYGAGSPQPPASGRRFSDVPADYWAAGWLEQVDRDRIYRGCGDFSTACPDQSLTRAQLAVFTVIARYGSDYALPPATGYFSDIPPSHWAARHIEQLVRDGVITDSCSSSTNSFCASDVATRSTAAVWTVRTFGL